MGQLKVLIVDDEYLIRNLIRNRINWEEQGMLIVGEASNASEAFDQVATLQPDIIFTDICMPFVDGIEFSRMIREKYPLIKIVIITGHEEFEFARKSISLGVADFILKPITVSELIGVTDRLRAKILEERSHSLKFEKLKEEFQRSVPFLREKFLNLWITQNMTDAEIFEKKQYYHIPFGGYDRTYQIAILEVTFPSQADITEEHTILLSMDCKQRTEVFFQDTPNTVIFTNGKNQIVVMSEVETRDFPNRCEMLKENLINSRNCLVCIGISGRHCNLSGVRTAYQEACRALGYKIFVGKDQVVCYEDIVETGEQHYHSCPDKLEKLHLYLNAGAAEKAIAVLTQIFKVPFSGIAQLRLAAMDVITQCQYVEIEQKMEDSVSLNKELLTKILLADTLPDLQKRLAELISSIANAVYAKTNTKAGHLVQQVITYLEQNLSNPELGISNTAAIFFVSPGHLGRLIKKETGQTFVEYLTGLRMKRAEALAANTELKAYQIGEQVGIKDPHYFSILFKKSVGKSLIEYRSAIK